MEYIFATTNEGKIREIREIFQKRGLYVRALHEIGRNFPEPEETGETLLDNAMIKARYYAETIDSGLNAVFAEDSGIFIDALPDILGVHSARFLGGDTPRGKQNQAILEMMKDVPDEKRTARFICAAVCVLPDGSVMTAEGAVEGIIAREPRGKNGFGYDPIFFIPEYGRTAAEITDFEKDRVSHRGAAFRALLDKII